MTLHSDSFDRITNRGATYFLTPKIQPGLLTPKALSRVNRGLLRDFTLKSVIYLWKFPKRMCPVNPLSLLTERLPHSYTWVQCCISRLNINGGEPRSPSLSFDMSAGLWRSTALTMAMAIKAHWSKASELVVVQNGAQNKMYTGCEERKLSLCIYRFWRDSAEHHDSLLLCLYIAHHRATFRTYLK